MAFIGFYLGGNEDGSVTMIEKGGKRAVVQVNGGPGYMSKEDAKGVAEELLEWVKGPAKDNRAADLVMYECRRIPGRWAVIKFKGTGSPLGFSFAECDSEEDAKTIADVMNTASAAPSA